MTLRLLRHAARLALGLFVSLTAAIALGCSGRDDQPTSTPPAPTATPLPVPTATPEPLVELAGPEEPLALVPDDLRTPLVPSLVIFNVAVGAQILPESERFFDTWLEMTPPLTVSTDGLLRLFERDMGRWMRVDLGATVQQDVSSPDGTRAAVTVDGRTYLIDLAGKRTQQEITTNARPLLFSPDGSKLLLLAPEQDGVGPFIVMPFDNPAAAVRLPLGQSPNEIAQHSPVWLDNDRVLLVSQHANLLQVFDVSGAVPRIELERRIESDQVAVSPDGRRLAVQEGPPTQAIQIYALAPFDKIGTWRDASLGSQLDVSSGVWNADGSKLLGTLGTCTDN